MEDENKRQNHRLEALEETVKQVAAISTSVEKLALNMENMLKEQVNQGKRLETLESQAPVAFKHCAGLPLGAQHPDQLRILGLGDLAGSVEDVQLGRTC